MSGRVAIIIVGSVAAEMPEAHFDERANKLILCLFRQFGDARNQVFDIVAGGHIRTQFSGRPGE
jgi:hypothetical protein